MGCVKEWFVTMDNKEQSSQSSRRSVSRRALLTAASAAGIGALAGCSGGKNRQTTTNGGQTTTTTADGQDTGGNQNNEPKPTSTNSVVTRIENDPQTIDPHVVPSQEDVAWMIFPPNAYETLIFYDGATDKLKPLLAKKVPTTENGLIKNGGKTYEFPLREGVKFHTGGTMTAEDVKFSLTRGATIGLSDDAGTMKLIDNVEVVNDHRVRVHLKEVYGPFLASALTRPIASVLSKKAVTNNGGVKEGQPNKFVATNTLGTGPYTLQDWQRGSYLRFDYFSDYWAPNTVTIKGVVQQQVVPQYSTTAAMMQNGKLHWVPTNAAALDSFQGIKNLQIKYTPSLDVAALHFNYNIPYGKGVLPKTAEDDTVPPDFFQNKDVRKGFAYAINYKQYIEAIWGGHATRMNYMHQPSARFYNPDAPVYEYNPKKAEEHFKKAGYWNEGFRVTCTTEAIPEFKQTQLFIKDHLESLNDKFTFNVATFPESRYSEFRNKRPWGFPCEMLGFLPMGGDPAPYYNGFFLEDGPIGAGSTGPDLKVSDVINPKIVELTKKGASTADPQKRRKIYHELQQLCYEDVPHAVLTVEDLVDVEQPCVQSVHNGLYEGVPIKSWDVSKCGNLSAL